MTQGDLTIRAQLCYINGMSNTAMVRARIEPELKRKAEGILARIGLTSTALIRMLYSEVVLYRGLPFPVRVPNRETRAALRQARLGKGTRYSTPEKLFKALGI